MGKQRLISAESQYTAYFSKKMPTTNLPEYSCSKSNHFQAKRAASEMSHNDDDQQRYQYFHKVPCQAYDKRSYELDSSPSCYEAALAVASVSQGTPCDSMTNSGHHQFSRKNTREIEESRIQTYKKSAVNEYLEEDTEIPVSDRAKTSELVMAGQVQDYLKNHLISPPYQDSLESRRLIQSTSREGSDNRTPKIISRPDLMKRDPSQASSLGEIHERNFDLHLRLTKLETLIRGQIQDSDTDSFKNEPEIGQHSETISEPIQYNNVSQTQFDFPADNRPTRQQEPVSETRTLECHYCPQLRQQNLQLQAQNRELYQQLNAQQEIEKQLNQQIRDNAKRLQRLESTMTQVQPTQLDALKIARLEQELKNSQQLHEQRIAQLELKLVVQKEDPVMTKQLQQLQIENQQLRYQQRVKNVDVYTLKQAIKQSIGFRSQTFLINQMESIVETISQLAFKNELEELLQQCSEMCFQISQQFNNLGYVDQMLIKMLGLVESQIHSTQPVTTPVSPQAVVQDVQETVSQDNEFISDFSDSDLTAEDRLTSKAISLVEELQPLINQQKTFRPQSIYDFHLALLNLDLEHEVRTLIYILWDVEFAMVKSLMKSKPISFWQDKVRSNAFELKNMPANQIQTKVLQPHLKYFQTCTKQIPEWPSQFQVNSKTQFRSAARRFDLTHIETYYLLSLCSDANGFQPAVLRKLIRDSTKHEQSIYSHKQSQKDIKSILKVLRSARVQMPQHTNHLSKKAFIALMSEINAPLDESTVSYLFDQIAVNNRLYIETLSKRLSCESSDTDSDSENQRENFQAKAQKEIHSKSIKQKIQEMSMQARRAELI